MSKEVIPEFKLSKSSQEDFPFKLELIEANVGYNPRAPHRHNYYEIFFFEKGGGIHMIDFNELHIDRNEVHILSPGQVHYMHRTPETTGWVLKFTSEFFLSTLSDKDMLQRIPFLNNKVSKPLIQPAQEEFDSLLQIVNFIKSEDEGKSIGYQNMIRNYLNLILVKCHRLYDYSVPNVSSPDNILCDAFNTLLQEKYLVENRIGYYCEMLNVSDNKLNAAVKMVHGKTPSEMISNRLLLEAKRLLLHSNKSIKEIAYELNFHDNAYFNRWFKKLENCPPGVFRSKKRKQYTP
ncbi:MAG: hypothetical protein CL840_06920 [Crocinitomicaceae bacterium]|nr:hypothetical protein [Crocinitomicaceae bacterium]|tara:strand:- start:8036 stop:8911 length:876 start_codon:yes stop_codon:yes gene_type:complete